jgi:hypothetical protein
MDRVMPRLTMSRHYYPLPGPPGERRAACSYCGMTFYRSDMVRDASGHLACPDDQDGRDTATLDRLNAQHAAKAGMRRPGVRD